MKFKLSRKEYFERWRMAHWHPLNCIVSESDIYTNGIYLQFADNPPLESISIYDDVLDGNYAEWCITNWRRAKREADKRNRQIRARQTVTKK